MEWSNDFLVNEHTLDMHHKKLFNEINILKKNTPISKSELLNKITFLVNYATFHFEYEEKLMQQYNYPETESHKLKHKSFIKKVDNLINDFNNMPVSLEHEDISDLIDFTTNWLYKHISIHDKKIVEFIRRYKV